MIRKSLLVLVFLCSQSALADPDFTLAQTWDNSAGSPLLLASNDDNHEAKGMFSDDLFHERLFTANKLHKYLGIGSIAAAAATVLTGPDDDEGGGGGEDEGGTHATLGRTAAALGVGAVVTGLLFHWDDIMLGNGFSDPDNLHAVLTTLGTLGYLQAIDQAPASAHRGYGSLGAVSMAIGIKIVW